MRTLFLTLILIILIVIAFGVYWGNKKTAKTAAQNNVTGTNLNAESAKEMPVETPFPFQEMTIPFLRERQYQSSLGERSVYQQYGTYTSYLSSYLSDGLKINALLTIPKSEKPAAGFPAIVFVHGYIPPTEYRTTEKYVDYVDYLASRGYVVLKIDLRGHGSSEGEAGGGYYSSDYVIDALNAYAALQSSDFVNPKKIGFWGHSMAGNVVLRALAAKPEIPVAVIWGGAGFTYTDLIEYRISDNSYRPQPSNSDRQRKRQELVKLYGNPDPNNWFWKLVIPMNYLTDYKGGIQLDHAVDDKTVSVEYSRNLNTILDSTSIAHELREYPNGDHNITNPSFTLAMQNTINYYNKFLKDR